MSIRKNTLWNLAGSGLPLIAAAMSIPYTLHNLGNESFGVLTLIWALIGYFSLFDMGVGRALTYELSKINGDTSQKNKEHEISLTLKSGLLVTVLTGVFGGLLILILSPKLAADWLKINPSMQGDSLLAFQIAAIGIVPTTITSGLRGALEGLERFQASNIIKFILGLCMFLLPALAILIHGNSLWMITLYLVLARFFVSIFAIYKLKKYLFEKIREKSKNSFTTFKERSRKLISYGVWLTISSVISPLMVVGDRFFVSAVVGAIALPLYAIPQEGLQRLLILPAALSGALMPKLSQLTPASAKHLYWETYKKLALTMFGVCLIAALLIYPAFTWWISEDFAVKTLPISLVLCFGIWLNSIAYLPYTFLHANGETKLTAIFHIIEFFIYVFLLWILTNRYGLIGAATAWTVRVGIDLALLHFMAVKLIKKSAYESQIENCNKQS